MNAVLTLLLENDKLSPAQMATVLGLTEAEVEAQLAALRAHGILLGWRPVLDPAAEAAGTVRAVIEVKIIPERGGGFNRLAERISRFDEVDSCYLVSGSYDLLVFVRGKSLQTVASFVSEKLATVDGVTSTATHFMLRAYKQQGYLLGGGEGRSERLDVAP